MNTKANLVPEEPAVGASVLIITNLEGIESTAAALAAGLRATVEIAASRAAALRLLDRRAYGVLVVDQTLVESDPEGADLLWKRSGLAIPLQVSFAVAGCARLEREVRAALTRRRREEALARAAAASAVDTEIRNGITGFLLESRLALNEPDLPPGLHARLRSMAAQAAALRERLDPAAVPLHGPERPLQPLRS